MKKYYLTLILIIFSIIGLNAQIIAKKHVFSEKAKAAFKQLATPESTLRWMTVKETEKVSKDLFLEKSKEIFDLDDKTTFKEIQVNETESDWKHHRLQQMYKGIPVEGIHYLVHEKNGLVETANGHVVAGLELNTTPSITEEVALQMLLNEIGAEKYAWEDEFSEKMLKHQKEDENATYFPKGEFIIASNSEDFNPENFTLAYKFRIKTVNPLSHADYIVDAFTGRLIYENSLLCQNDVQGSCQTHRYGTQTITTDFNGTNYNLKESVRNIDTYNGLSLASDQVGAVEYLDSDNVWTDPNHKSACEAHWGMEKTYDYFLNEQNWNGHNNYGSKFITWVNVGNNWNNAQGGGGQMYLGEGDGVNYGPFTSIDIVAHEFTHSVIQITANLQYSRESGALNESFADIFGTMVEFYAEPNPNNRDWLLGEDIVLNGSAFRDMSNPSLKGHPNTYKDENWKNITASCGYTNDNCGVHTNSGVQNHWFYILANGKADTNYYGYDYDVSGIGMDKAAKLALENLKNYLGPFSDYLDARNGAIQAANALNFTANEISQVEEAWCAVGLGDCSINSTGTIAVTSPNGGETLNPGIAKNITWTNTSNIGTEVKIEYSINAGNEWHSITNATTNDGAYQWFPPSVATNLALVRVSSISDETIFDSSDEYFTINACNVNANFTVSDEQPCANTSVLFTSTSTGANTYKWYINGTLYQNGPTFNYTFTQAGQYEIELRATVGSTCGDIEIFNLSVQPNANANFTYSSASEAINFVAPDNHFDATYFWTTGDGENYDTPNLSKIYDSAGSYTVCLTVNSSCGSDNECKTVQANIFGCIDATACNFDDSATVDDGNCIYGNCNNCLEADSLALVALYNATDGPNWTNTWNLSQPVNTWHGITTSGCHVTRIFLYNNNLVGSIPPELGSLQNLYFLNLDRNDLTGSIPVELGNLQNLQSLSIFLSNLTGSIPPELGNLQNLQFLNLSNNTLTGSIPVEIEDLENLLEIRLNTNRLSGAIPSELGNLQYLKNLALDYNLLSGPIPSELGNLQHLQYLKLNSNRLTSIPPELGNLQNLQYLDLNSNRLTGYIPPELGSLQNLYALHLHINSLTGSIPPELGNLQNLQSLYLYSNNLGGAIPAELGNLQNLESLLLLNNSLAGSIPSELGSLQNLKDIKLYDNILTGCYPQGWCNLTFPNFTYNFDCSGNSGLPDNGSDQGFIDFCNGTSTCSSAEVYPGDLNFDGVTNHKDILAFGVYNGEFGPSRETAYQGLNWSAQPSEDWGIRQENDSDIKHTDADGNGVVDLSDVEAIEMNYGNTHTASPVPPAAISTTDGPIEVSLQVNAMPSFVGNDDQLVLDIRVDDVYGSEVAMYGGYFTVDYNDPDLVVNDIEVVFNQSWFGTPDQNVEYIVYDDDTNKKIDIGITKVDHQNSIGEGVIGQLIVSVDNETPWDTIGLDFIVSDIALQNVEEFALPVGVDAALTSFQIVQLDCVPALNITTNTALDYNHIAQGLIQTNGNITVNEIQPVTFRSDRLKVNDSFNVKSGGEFTYYNDPCGTANRGANTGGESTRRDAMNRVSTVGFYQIDEDNLIYNFELNEPEEVSIEIVDENGKTTKHDFDIKQSGKNQIILPIEKLPKGKYIYCLKIGVNRYYTQSNP